MMVGSQGSSTEVSAKRIRRNPTGINNTNSNRTALSPTTERRRRLSTLRSARRTHGSVSGDDTAAVTGLWNTFVNTASACDLAHLLQKSKKVTTVVKPSMLSESVTSFNSSTINSTRSLVALYRNGILSKSKYESLHRCLGKQYSPHHQRTKFLELAPGVRIDRILSYKQLVEHIKKEDIGVLQPLPEVPGTPTVKGLCRPLKSLVTVMADLFLNNKRMASTLKWFDEPYTFHYAIGGDGAPYGRGDTTLTIWCVSFLNRGRHIGSPQDNFLLAVAACDESHPAMIRYAQCLQDEVKALDDVVEVAGHPCKFVCGLLPVDMKFLATYAGER